MRVLIIGGSLTGLTLALALAHRGVQSCVLERASAARCRGGTLGVNCDLLMQAIGGNSEFTERTHPFPVLSERRGAVSWQAIHGWLRMEALLHPEIVLKNDVPVIHVAHNRDSATAKSTDGHRFVSDLVIGADGYRSLVRCKLDPGQPRPKYAGYLLWRGLVDETELPLNRLPRSNEEAVLINQCGHRLVAYPVAGWTGSLAVGQRLLSFTWYDARCNRLLQGMRCIDGSGNVLGSLKAQEIPEHVREELCKLAFRLWPDPWCTVITHALERRQVFATPVAEYSPRRMITGRLAIIGDAAHLVSPFLGRGFVSGIEDAATLAKCLSQVGDTMGQDIHAALVAYESERLPKVRALVAVSRKWSQSFVANWSFTSPSSGKVMGTECLENKSSVCR